MAPSGDTPGPLPASVCSFLPTAAHRLNALTAQVAQDQSLDASGVMGRGAGGFWLEKAIIQENECLNIGWRLCKNRQDLA
jgi:hypothetical protein